MLTSENQKDNFLLQLDDDEEENEEKVSIDTGHQFLNFSRKVTKASSMRKPVDIQLGIAFGKDLLFNSSSPSRRGHQPVSNNKSDSAPTSPLLARKVSSNYNKKKLVLPFTNNNNKPKYYPISPSATLSLPTPVSNDTITTTINNNHLSPQQPSQILTKTSSSPLLDRLVADVLSHIESCPDHSAYSVDLDRLKPKLQAYYSVMRPPPSINQ